MRTLYHLPIDPGCREVRLVLAEKKLACAYRVEPFWERRSAFLNLNPAGEVPVLVEADGTAVPGARVILEYLEEVYPEPTMIGSEPAERAEVRRISAWFEDKFAREVTLKLLGEKIMKRLAGSGAPSSTAIRDGHANIHYHLEYIGWLSDRRRWLAGDEFSRADAAAAAHLSALDYQGDVPWAEHALAKDWYARVKSRPTFRDILADHIPGIRPAADYANLDF